jgi:magnesium-transporting ATPase (P-type)
MGFRFYRRLRIAPGLSVNLSRSGPSLSLGVRGAHVTVGRKGVTKTIGLPGTGMFFTSRTGFHTGYHSAAAVTPQSAEQQVASDRHVERAIGVAVLIVLAAFLGWWLAQ